MSLKSFHNKGLIEAGCDEAGRGCLAGPVTAAAVILPPDFKHPLLNDSKQLTEKQRDKLRPIVEMEAIAWGVGMLGNEEIDEINILQASIAAMHRSLDKLSTSPEFILVDGNRFNAYKDIPHACIIKGDGKYLNIAAASILAKTYRDELMHKLHTQHPEFGWDRNKGYPTKEHRTAIAKFGATALHRKSFRLLEDDQNLKFQ